MNNNFKKLGSYQKKRIKQEEINCLQCGIKFIKRNSRSKYCSGACYVIYHNTNLSTDVTKYNNERQVTNNKKLQYIYNIIASRDLSCNAATLTKTVTRISKKEIPLILENIDNKKINTCAGLQCFIYKLSKQDDY